MLSFRELTANTMNKLVRFPGIVISASVLSSRATKLHLTCRACYSVKIMYPSVGLGGIGGGTDRGLPRVCDAPAPDGQKKDCPLDPYIIVHSKSTFSDHQVLKLQEAPDMVPVGELPRHILLSADRYLTNNVVPGSRIIATGVYSTYLSGRDVRNYIFLHRPTPYIHTHRWFPEIRKCCSTTIDIPALGASGTIVTTCRCCGWPKSFRCAILSGRRGRVW